MYILSPSLKVAFKPILTLSILLVFNLPTYSQQNSKILHYLQEELKDKALYFEQLDSITKKTKGTIFSRSKNVTFPDFRKTAELQHHEIAFEDLIKVVPSNLKLFNQYSVDTIWFYFNKAKLIRCWYQFKLPTNGYNIRDKAVDSIYKKLNQGFNLGYERVETNIAGYDGYRWTDKYVEVDFLTNFPIPRAQKNFNVDSSLAIAYISIEMFKPVEVNTLLEKQKTQVKTDRSGKGNSTFNISASKLEQIMKSHTTLNVLENKFGNWSSFGALNNVAFEYDEATKNFTIPHFKIEYESTIKNKEYYFKAEVSNLKGPLEYLEFTTSINGLQLAEFKKSLYVNNYLLNENLTKIFKKLTYQNRAKKTMVTIKENINGTYTIGIR